MRIVRHPFVERDLIGMVDHILDVTQGDFAAAERRLADADALIATIAANPRSGVRLGGALSGWCVRHGGAGHRLTVVFKPDMDTDRVFIALIAFGGRDWIRQAASRRVFVD